MKSPHLTRCFRELHSIREQLARVDLSLQALARPVVAGPRPEGLPLCDEHRLVDTIKEIIAAHFGLAVRDLSSKRRTDRLAWPRQIAMALSYMHAYSYCARDVGAQFNRDKGTVLHACKVLANRLATEPATKAVLDIINTQIAAALK